MGINWWREVLGLHSICLQIKGGNGKQGNLMKNDVLENQWVKIFLIFEEKYFRLRLKENRNTNFIFNFFWKFLQYKINFSISDMEFSIAKFIFKQALSKQVILMLVILGNTKNEKVQHNSQDSSLL